MENNLNNIETLLENTATYGKTSFELVKLKVLDKTSDKLSSFFPHTIVAFIIVSFLLFANLGLAFWLGELLGRIYFGFFVLAGAYAFIALVMHLFLRKWLKRIFYDFLIRSYDLKIQQATDDRQQTTE
jgi:Zn-dependent protease with chaperone function